MNSAPSSLIGDPSPARHTWGSTNGPMGTSNVHKNTVFPSKKAHKSPTLRVAISPEIATLHPPLKYNPKCHEDHGGHEVTVAPLPLVLHNLKKNSLRCLVFAMLLGGSDGAPHGGDCKGGGDFKGGGGAVVGNMQLPASQHSTPHHNTLPLSL